MGTLTKWSCELQLRTPADLHFPFLMLNYILEALQRTTLHDLCLTSVPMFVLLQVTIDLSIADRRLFFESSASMFNWSRTLGRFAQTKERRARVCRQQQRRGRRGLLEKPQAEAGYRLPPAATQLTTDLSFTAFGNVQSKSEAASFDCFRSPFHP